MDLLAFGEFDPIEPKGSALELGTLPGLFGLTGFYACPLFKD